MAAFDGFKNFPELEGSFDANVILGVQGPPGPMGPAGPQGSAGEDGEDGGHYTPAVTQLSENKLEFAFTPSKTDMPSVNPVQVTLPAGTGSGGNVENGEDGFSPIATVTQTASGAVISITDKYGTTNATITNGKDGKDGADGQPGAKGDKGDPGEQGEPGEDGKTPVKGTDYWTTADRQQMVADVLAALPAAEGGSF